MRQNSVTMKDIARKAGVSVMTVSRALRGAKGVGEAKAEEIRKVAEEMGYTFNPLVQSVLSDVRRGGGLRTTANLAWIVQQASRSSRKAILSQLERAAKQRAATLGFELIHVPLDPRDEPAPRALQRMLEARGVVGAIIAPLEQPGTVPSFPYEAFPVATIGRSLREPAIHYTMSHYYHGMELMIAEIQKRGLKRPGLLLGREMNVRSDHAFSMGFRDLGPRHEKAIQFTEGWSREDVEKWMREYHPDAVITDSPGSGGLLPDAWLSDESRPSFFTLSWKKDAPHWSGIRQPFAELAAGAVDMVVAQIHRGEKGLPTFRKAMLIEGEWME